MGKVGVVSKASKNQGPCDTCGVNIFTSEEYKHTFREATREEKFGTKSQRRKTHLRNDKVMVLVKVHVPDCKTEG